MKIDFSTFLLIVIAVIPGFAAQQSRNRIAPRSVDPQGPSAELAELVALGLATDCLLVFAAGLVMVLGGALFFRDPLVIVRRVDLFQPMVWSQSHLVEASLLLAAYFFLSILASYGLGFGYGVLRMQRPLPASLMRRDGWLARHGVHGVLSERPVLYEALKPVVKDGAQSLVFVELEMKNGVGFYSGQVDQFALARDEEAHKPLSMLNAWHKSDALEGYESLGADRVVVDMADVAVMLVKQRPDAGTEATS